MKEKHKRGGKTEIIVPIPIQATNTTMMNREFWKIQQTTNDRKREPKLKCDIESDK